MESALKKLDSYEVLGQEEMYDTNGGVVITILGVWNGYNSTKK